MVHHQLLLTFHAALCLIQFVPLSINLHLENAPVVESLGDFDVQMVASFCLGFLSLILIDIAVDISQGNTKRIISRSLYYWIAITYSLLIIAIDDDKHIGAIYLCYLSFTSVYYVGRALIDLCVFDTTGTWTHTKAVVLIALLATGFLCGSYSTAYEIDHPGPLLVCFLALLLISLILFLSNSILCFYRKILLRDGTSFLYKVVQSITSFEDAMLFLIMTTVIVCSVLLVMSSFIFQTLSGFRLLQPKTIIFDMILRLIFASILEIIPSLLFKTLNTSKVGVLQNDLNMKSTFVRYIGHEVRTPLNIAVVGLDLVKRILLRASKKHGKVNNDEILTLLEEVEDSCKVAVTQLDDLLAYEKLCSGLLHLDKSIVNVANFIKTSTSLFNIQARGKNIRIAVMESAGVANRSLHFEIDYTKLTQVMRNLISNAIKFTPEGKTIYVDAYEVLEHSEQGGVLIQVRDSGVGIAKENLHKVFNEIVQFDANKNQGGGGSGIGLWISKKIVDLHGGVARVQSRGLGHGCTFEVLIPLTPAAKATKTLHRSTIMPMTNDQRIEEIRAAVVVSNESIGKSIGRLKSIESHSTGEELKPSRVLQRMLSGHCVTTDEAEANDIAIPHLFSLIVDDSKLNRKFMARLLLLFNMTVDEAEDGVDCIEKVKLSMKDGRRFDAIFMDNNMPNMNGMEATQELRTIGFKGVIIGVTGDGRAESISGFIERGADDVLVKPITHDQLLACLKDCVKRRQKSITVSGGLQLPSLRQMSQHSWS